MKKIYLSGGIDGLKPEYVLDWRILADEMFQRQGVMTLDPCRREFNRDLQSLGEMVNSDKWDIQHSDAVLVNLNWAGPGTNMELMYAYDRCKPIVAFTDVPYEKNSPWHQFHCMRIEKDLPEAVDYLVNMLRWEQ